MSAISASVYVSRPAEEVFAYAIDPTRFHEWQKVTAEVTHIDPLHS